MSAKFRLEKKKAQQEELRKLMKLKTNSKDREEKIDSPLAKYNNIGQLTCVVCVSTVTAQWKIHINTKRHKEAVQLALQLKDKVNAPKRPAPGSPPLHPQKKIKGILKNSKSQPKEDTPQGESVPKTPADIIVKNGVRDEPETVTNGVEQEEILPEGFFDDPLMDAKARNIQYKNPVEEEWEAFQKAIKEETSVSAAIIAGEHEEATAERQIDEIDEQIRIWTKVLDLERKKEEAGKQKASQIISSMDCDEDSSNDEEDFDEYLDWRAKKS